MHEKAVKQRSITPETYRGEKTQFAQDESFYVDEYQYKNSVTSHVLHFGINIYRDGLKVEIDEHNKTQKEISESKLTSNTNNHKAISQNTSLTKHEQLVVLEAVKYIDQGNGKLKTALVDVFKRDKSSMVSPSEIHTVVLCNNNTNDKIFVIDPNNPQFSSHIANLSNLSPRIQVDYSDKAKIYQPPEKAREQNLVGPGINQWRDCVDIAVKIAFGLNKSSELSDLKAIMSSEAVRNIANSYKINDSIPDQIQEKSFVKIPLRIQQNSNLKVNEDFYKFSKTIKQNLVDIKNKIDLEDKYINALYNSSSGNSHVDTLKDLYSISENTFKQIHAELHEQQLEILGQGFNSNIYDEV